MCGVASPWVSGGCLLQAWSCLLQWPPQGPGEAVLIPPAQQGGLGLPQLSLSCLAPPKFWGRTGLVCDLTEAPPLQTLGC